MKKSLIKNFSLELMALKLTDLRESINNTLLHEGMFFIRNALIDEVQTIKLDYNQFKVLDTENKLFYLNYNKKFALSKFAECSYENRLDVLKNLLTLDMTKKVNRIHLADFILWGICYLYKDKDMAKLVKYFCDNTNYKDSKIIYDVYIVLTRLYDESKCKIAMDKKYDELKKEQEIRAQSRNIL